MSCTGQALLLTTLGKVRATVSLAGSDRYHGRIGRVHPAGSHARETRLHSIKNEADESSHELMLAAFRLLLCCASVQMGLKDIQGKDDSKSNALLGIAAVSWPQMLVFSRR